MGLSKNGGGAGIKGEITGGGVLVLRQKSQEQTGMSLPKLRYGADLALHNISSAKPTQR